MFYAKKTLSKDNLEDFVKKFSILINYSTRTSINVAYYARKKDKLFMKIGN